MKFQTVYRTNADYIESWKKLELNPRIERVYESRKGHLVFKFRNTNLRVELVEATGRLIIYYRDESEKESYFPLLKEVLATKDGSHVEIQPLHANVFRIPYPEPKEFKIAWCNRKTTYLKKGCDPWIWCLAPLATGLSILLVSK